MKARPILSAFVISFWLAGCAATTSGGTPSNVPLPTDLKVSAPPDSVPPEVRAFSGKWVGTWDAGLAHVLVVEDIPSADRVTVVYAFGSNQFVRTPGFTRVRGTIASGKLNFKLSNGAVVTYVLTPSDDLKAEYERPGEIVRATMKRVQE